MSNDTQARGREWVTKLVRWVGLLVRALLGTPARAAKGTARRVADPARQVVNYFGSERQTIRQGFAAVVVASVTSLGAGLVLAGMDKRLGEVAGLLVLIPVSIGMRGAIFGAFTARIGTSIHSGLFEVSRDRSGVFFQNIYAATLLTLATAATMGVLARAIAGLLGVETVSVWDFIVIALIGGLLSSAVVLAVAIVLSIQSFQRGWDLDSVGAPLITAIGDVVTLPCLLLASFAIGHGGVTATVGVIGVIAGLASLFKGWTTSRAVTRKIVREGFPVLVIAIVLDVLAGAVVEPRFGATFGPFPAFLIILPGFIANTGALGSVLAGRLGSKLHLGAVTPSAKPEAAALLDGAIVLVLGLTVYSLTAIGTVMLAELVGAAYPGAFRFIGVTLLGGMLATAVAAVIGYYAAITTFRFGFDPDNHTIPLVTSGMDLLGVICLVVALIVFGVA